MHSRSVFSALSNELSDIPRSALGAEVAIPVSVLNQAIGSLLERSFPLVWVAGEVSNFTCAASGHWYFSIKDAHAQIRCAMFRRRAQYAEFTPREGDKIEVRACVAMYEPRGELQLNVEAVRRTGLGRLYEAFMRLKAKLDEQGLFAKEKKRALPAHPRAIGVVTSLQAAALRDVLSTLARRAPHIPVIVYPTPVQGVGASEKLASMIQIASVRREVDVLIICRGGGSIEDLWAFNEEVLALAIAGSAVPIVSGVGHETDVTIADFVADVRAPTPTGAAELVSPQHAVMMRELVERWRNLTRGYRRAVERRAQQLDWFARRLVSPAEHLARQRVYARGLQGRLASAGMQSVREARARFALIRLRWQRSAPSAAVHYSALNSFAQRLNAATLRNRERQTARIATLAARLAVLNPKHTLARGYAALVEIQTGEAVRSPSGLETDKRFTIYLASGCADISLANVQPHCSDDNFGG